MTDNTNTFAAPAASSDAIEWKSLMGRLLLVEPYSFEPEFQTAMGAKDAVRCTLSVLDGDEAGRIFEDALIFPKVLVSSTRTRLGEKVLARLGQGVAKPGQSAPWTFEAANENEADVALAVRFLNARAAGALGAPAPATAAAPAAAAPAAAPPAAAPQGGTPVPF